MKLKLKTDFFSYIYSINVKLNKKKVLSKLYAKLQLYFYRNSIILVKNRYLKME